MFEQDSIIRQIRQFTSALEKVIFKKKEGKKEEALVLIEQSLKEFSGDNAKKFHDLSLKQTMISLQREGTLNAELALVVADLLFEEAELLPEGDSQHCYLQVLLLYKKALENPEVVFPLHAVQKISQIEKELDSSMLDEVEKLME